MILRPILVPVSTCFNVAFYLALIYCAFYGHAKSKSNILSAAYLYENILCRLSFVDYLMVQ